MDDLTASLADSQFGLLAAWQLDPLGWTESAIRWARRRRVLVPYCPRVYALGHRPACWEAPLLAAALSVGEGSVISHQSAAAVWKLLPRRQSRVHVTTAGRARSRPDLRIHHSSVGPADRTVRDGIPVTTLPRTLVDLADVLEPARLAQAVERIHLLDVRAMRRCLDRHPGRRATGALARLLEAYDPRTRSVLEGGFLAMCRDHGIPQPLVNARIAGAERDFAWPDVRLVVETDGAAFHAGRAARNADSRRDVDLGIAGWRVHRLTYERVVLDPAGTAAAVLALRAAG